MLIKVLNPDNFGELVDKILTLEGFVITSIEWQPDEVLSHPHRAKSKTPSSQTASKRARRCARNLDSPSTDLSASNRSEKNPLRKRKNLKLNANRTSARKKNRKNKRSRWRRRET